MFSKGFTFFLQNFDTNSHELMKEEFFNSNRFKGEILKIAKKSFCILSQFLVVAIFSKKFRNK